MTQTRSPRAARALAKARMVIPRIYADANPNDHRLRLKAALASALYVRACLNDPSAWTVS